MTTIINNEHKKLNVPNLRFPEFQGGVGRYTLFHIQKGIPIGGFDLQTVRMTIKIILPKLLGRTIQYYKNKKI